ncbi:MAG: hypothetical protein PHC61_18705 [Chitinivibrionales bacterium]|nr:hypothetical protein [Chitinivibrionales bacterium]
MPHWLIAALLIVFIVHCIVFSILTIKNKSGYYLGVTVTFFLLVVAYAMRLWASDWSVAGIKGFWYFRIAAWVLAGVSIYLTLRRRRRPK